MVVVTSWDGDGALLTVSGSADSDVEWALVALLVTVLVAVVSVLEATVVDELGVTLELVWLGVEVALVVAFAEVLLVTSSLTGGSVSESELRQPDAPNPTRHNPQPKSRRERARAYMEGKYARPASNA